MTYEVEARLTVSLEVHPAVMARCDDATMPYGAMTPEDMLGHLLWNVVVNHADLSLLDGFADLDNSMLSVTYHTLEIEHAVEQPE